MKNVVIIGCGLSGLSCAIKNAESGNHVTLISANESERSQSVMAAGGINAVDIGTEDSVAAHTADTLKGGVFLEDEKCIERMCRRAPEILGKLESMGVVFSRTDAGKIDRRAFGGQSYKRTAYAGAATGKQLVSALVQKCREYECNGLVERKSGRHFHSAVIRDGVCYGVICYNDITGETEAYKADAVVVAAGGQNLLFGKTTGARACDGYTAARLMEQGVEMRNLEFIQYHPTTIETPQKRMLISEAARGEGGRLFYFKDNEKVYFMEDKYGPNGNLMPRDIVSKEIYNIPSQVYLDISFLGDKIIDERLSEIRDVCRSYAGIDVKKEFIPVYPSVHFFMGGIRVDDNHKTNIDRLYAVGECASKYHGANRLGGNSLLAAVYSGIVAAEHITAEVSGMPATDAYVSECVDAFASEVEKQLCVNKNTESSFPAYYVRKELETIMKADLGITRTEQKLSAGLKDIDFLIDASGKLHYDPNVSVYETYSLQSICRLAKGVILSALYRKETRGAHIREDYPELSDVYSKPTVLRYRDGEFTVGAEGEV